MVTSALIVYYIDDVDQALSFYNNAVGLKVLTESPGWSTLNVVDGFEIGLHIRGSNSTHVAADKHPFDTGETTLAFNVDDLEACCTRITEQGGSLDRVIEPREEIPVRMGLVRDPSGNGFQVNQYAG